MNNNSKNDSLVQYRIKEEKYMSGISRYIPEGFFEGNWWNLAHKAFGFNTNGKDWCNTIEEAKLVIKFFNIKDEIIEETYHTIIVNE